MSTKCLKILDAPKREFLELKFFQNDEKNGNTTDVHLSEVFKRL